MSGGEFQAYPSWRDHEDGRSVIVHNAEEDAALGKGWSARGTVVHQPTDGAGVPVAEGDVQAYPGWRHHVSGKSQIVNSPEEDEALGAGWYRDAGDAKAAANGQAPAAETSKNDETDATEDEVPVSLYDTPAAKVVELLPTIADAAHLRELNDVELANPKYPGGRKSVLEAIRARLAELEATPPAPPAPPATE